MYLILKADFLLFPVADSCTPEKVENGKVLELNKGTWKIECDPGYSLVGRSIIKCRNNLWSTSKFPSCTGKNQKLYLSDDV